LNKYLLSIRVFAFRDILEEENGKRSDFTWGEACYPGPGRDIFSWEEAERDQRETAALLHQRFYRIAHTGATNCAWLIWESLEL
jgi:hypothetical protein